MLHWPDSMMTYCEEDKVLFSQDGFGQHIASSARFDDEFIADFSEAELDDAVVDYYANILMPFGQVIKAKLAEFEKLGLDVGMIAPDHGVIWRAAPQRVLSLYRDMAEGKARLRTAIIYDTMWQSTALMANPIAEGVRAEGIECEIIKLRATPMSAAIKEFWKSRGALIGTPTLNNIMYPSVAEYLTHLRGLRPKNRLVGAFGSFGWAAGPSAKPTTNSNGWGSKHSSPACSCSIDLRLKMRRLAMSLAASSPKSCGNTTHNSNRLSRRLIQLKEDSCGTKSRNL